MRIGFSGTRRFLEWHQRQTIIGALEALVPVMSYAITGACIGVDAFIARWLAEHTDIQQILIVPHYKDYVDETLYTLPRLVIIEMPWVGELARSYRERNEKIVELCDRLVAFPERRAVRSGTRMTINIAKKKGVIENADIHPV